MEWPDKNYIFLNLLARLKEIRAWSSRKRFYCKALKGDSDYSVCINSDMNVSCNCNDAYGLGKIGNIDRESLEEIFRGKKAESFRRKLTNGKLPIPNCAVCDELSCVDKKRAEEYSAFFNLPLKGIMVENTIKCNLNCLSCSRRMIAGQRKKMALSLKDVEKIARLVNKYGIKKICYFNLGEPFFSDTIKNELEIIKKANPGIYLSISTNGMLLNSMENIDSALLLDDIIFSIDGSTQASIQIYQRGMDFKQAYSNMANLAAVRNSRGLKRPKITWKYVLFRWNDSRPLLIRAIELAKEADVDYIDFVLTRSPLFGISYRHLFGVGYLDKVAKRKGITYSLKIS